MRSISSLSSGNNSVFTKTLVSVVGLNLVGQEENQEDGHFFLVTNDDEKTLDNQCLCVHRRGSIRRETAEGQGWLSCCGHPKTQHFVVNIWACLFDFGHVKVVAKHHHMSMKSASVCCWSACTCSNSPLDVCEQCTHCWFDVDSHNDISHCDNGHFV